MNPRLPRVSGRELVTALETIGPGLLARILRQAKLSADGLRDLL